MLERCLLVIACVAACHSAQAPAVGTCGAPLAVADGTTRPVPVIAAPERERGAIFVGTRYLAQQTGSSVLVWDLVLGIPTSITRDVQLLGIAGDADRFLVQRDKKIVMLEPSGRLAEQVSDRPLTDVVAARVAGSARYVGLFHETGIVALPMWTDRYGRAEDFIFGVGCPGNPALGNPNDDFPLAISTNGAIGAAPTTQYNQFCGELPPRVLTWDLARPEVVAQSFEIPSQLTRHGNPRVFAVSDEGKLAVVGNDSGGAALVALEAGHVRIVMPIDQPIGGAALVGGQLVATIGDKIQAWDLVTRKVTWTHAGTIAAPPLPGERLLVATPEQLALVDAKTGRESWHHHRDGGAVSVSRDAARAVVGPASDGALQVVDLATGRAVRKIAAVPLRGVRGLAFTDQGLVASDGATLSFWSLEDGTLAERVPYPAADLARDQAGHLATATEDADHCQRVDTWDHRRPVAGPRHCDDTVDLASARTTIGDRDSEQRVAYRIGGGSGAAVPLAPAHLRETELVLSRDGRRAAAFATGQRDSYGDTTAVATWDTATGELLAEVGPPLTQHEQWALFNGVMGEHGYVGAVIEDAALSPRGALVAVARRYTHMNKPNWSFETVEGDAVRTTVLHTDTGERALPDLDAGGVIAFASDDVLIAADGRTLHAFRGKDEIGKATFDGTMVTAIAASADGRMIATAHADGVIRLWTTEGLVLRATLLDYADDEWLAMTPGGAYVGTAEVGERVSWTYSDPLEPFGFAEFTAMQRPDVVRARVATGEGDVEPPRARPPHVELIDAPASTAEASAVVHVRAVSASRVDDVRFYVEGKPVAQSGPCGDARLDARIPLEPGPNRVTVVAFDDHGLASNPLSVDIVRTSAAARPDLWVVAVGINHYPGLTPDAQLGYAVPDARSIAEAFRAQAGPGRAYAHAHVTLLEDEHASPRAIIHAVDALRDMKRDAVAIVFLAGHGIKHGATGDMVFLTGSVRAPMGKLDDATVDTGSISWSELGQGIERAPGRVVMLVDACHAGHMDQQLLAPNDDLARKLGNRAGVVVFAASKGRQVSMEPNGARGFGLTKDVAAQVKVPPGHGLFTAALLASLGDPETDRNGDGAVQLSELVDEVTWRVRRATHDVQTPWIVRRELFGDFVLGGR